MFGPAIFEFEVRSDFRYIRPDIVWQHPVILGPKSGLLSARKLGLNTFGIPDKSLGRETGVVFSLFSVFFLFLLLVAEVRGGASQRPQKLPTLPFL